MAPRLLLAAAVAAALSVLPSAATAATPKTVWLCRPGLAHNPCTPGLKTTLFSPSGKRLGVRAVKASTPPGLDCFYVYPTVSDQKTINSNLKIEPVERSVARFQAARYSQECRVFAPMYRQATLTALLAGTISARAGAIAFSDVRNAWHTYLRKYNKGRGVVLIGHSQGTFMLRRLITTEIDNKASERRKLISALLLGANVTVRKGSDVGGDFKHVPACRAQRQTGCVVAFSTFDAPVPQDSKFGRTSTRGLEILCTDPAALGGGSGILDPIEPNVPFYPKSTLSAGIALLGVITPKASTPWIEAPGSYRARCSGSGGAHVLQITARNGAPTYKPSPDPTWGLHLVDANIALGNLIRLVRAQSSAYLRRHA